MKLLSWLPALAGAAIACYILAGVIIDSGWRMRQGVRIESLPKSFLASALAGEPNALIIAEADGSLALIEDHRRFRLERPGMMVGQIEKLACSSDGRVFAIATKDGQLWQGTIVPGKYGVCPPGRVDYEELGRFNGLAKVASLDLALVDDDPKKPFITVGYNVGDRGVIVGRALWSEEEERDEFPAQLIWAGYAPKARTFVAVDRNKLVYDWQAGSFPAQIGKLRMLAEPVTGFALSADGRFLAACENDVVHLNSLGDRKRVVRWQLSKYFAPGTSFAFSEPEHSVLCRIPNGDVGYIQLPLSADP